MIGVAFGAGKIRHCCPKNCNPRVQGAEMYLIKIFPLFSHFRFLLEPTKYLSAGIPHPTIALNFRIRTQRERSWNYANEYLFPLPLLQALLRLEVSWREREKNGSVIRELPNDLDVIRIIKIRTKPWWSFFRVKVTRNHKYKNGWTFNETPIFRNFINMC